jgi:hypothetical protein
MGTATTATTAGTTANTHHKRNLLQHARRIEDNNDDQQGNQQQGNGGAAEVEQYLHEYSVKLIKCDQDVSLNDYSNSNNNNDDGGNDDDSSSSQYGVVVFRMCPSNSCKNNNQNGCTSGYADFAISLGDFVNYYLEDQQDNMQWDDDRMDLDNFAQCVEYETENDGNDNDDDANQNAYYIGPSCTSDALDIKLDLFSDAYCRKPSTTKTFQELSNGWTLPFSDGGLVSTNCVSCEGNDNANGEGDGDGGDGDYQASDLCLELYQDSQFKCENDGFATTHYYYDAITEIYRYGRDTTGCRPINRLIKVTETHSEVGEILFVSFLVIVSVVGVVAYTMWWKESTYYYTCLYMYPISICGLTTTVFWYYSGKATLEKIDSDDVDGDGDDDYHQQDEDDHDSDDRRPVGAFA